MPKRHLLTRTSNFLDLKELGKRAVTVVVLTLTAIMTVWAYAAFIEPSAGPNDSDQDFAQNILGANNANNDFDSSAVTADGDGSIIERAEQLQQYHSVPAADATNNAQIRDVVGNKSDAAVTSVATTKSLMGYIKGLLGFHTVPAADVPANSQARDVIGNKIDTATTTVGTTKSLMAYMKGVLEQVDTTVSSRASGADYTSARATKLDNLDAAISSRLAASSYVTERGTGNAALASDYTSARATKLDNLDATVSSRASASDYTSSRAAKLDNLDATISSRALDSEVGDASDAASMSTTLFAGQQYIYDKCDKVQWAGYTASTYSGF